MTARLTPLFLVLGAGLLLAGCATTPGERRAMSEHECLARAMYFESNRSSEEGMIAVGTVVMNRVNSPDFPDTVCAVVGQKNQFAPGVLTRRMEKGQDLAAATARKVLRGTRHAEVGKRSMFFHTAGYSFPYDNMHYVAIAGGNAFYEKRRDASVTQAQVQARTASRNAPSPAARPAPRPSSAPQAVSLAPMSVEDLIRAAQ